MDFEQEILNINKKIDAILGYINPIKPNTFTLYTWFDYWIETYKKDSVKNSWYKDKKRYLEKIKTLVVDVPLDKISVENINIALSTLKNSNSKEKLIITLKDCLTCAWKNHYIREDISQLIIDYKHTCVPGKALTVHERELFLKNICNSKYCDFLLFIFFTGCRLHGALNLTWQDVDFEKRVLHIPETKTQSSDRYIRMIKQVYFILKNQPKRGQKVFQISKKTVDRTMQKISAKCKFKVCVKDLRTTYATFCSENNIADIFTQKTMGHSNITTTKHYYQKVLSDFEIQESKKLENGFDVLCNNAIGFHSPYT